MPPFLSQQTHQNKQEMKGSIFKLLRRVKLAFLLLGLLYMQANAHSYSQIVSFTGKDVPLESAFASIEKQTGLSFFFNYALLKEAKPITVSFKNIPLEEA